MTRTDLLILDFWLLLYAALAVVAAWLTGGTK